MKKGLIITGECILWIIFLVVVKIVLGAVFPTTEDNNIISFILYFLSGMGSVLIYRINEKKK